MGQKIHPTAFRLSYKKKWLSVWFTKNKELYRKNLHGDHQVRCYIKKKLRKASISNVFIKRSLKNALVTIACARPGIAIGKKGEEIEALKFELELILGVPVHVNVEEVRRPDADSELIASSICQQIEKRTSPRRPVKRAIQNAMRLPGVEGIKVEVSGRINGADIARREVQREGSVPLQTLRNDISYASVQALTSYGILGVKVWVNLGETGAGSLEPQADILEAQPVSQMPVQGKVEGRRTSQRGGGRRSRGSAQTSHSGG